MKVTNPYLMRVIHHFKQSAIGPTCWNFRDGAPPGEGPCEYMWDLSLVLLMPLHVKNGPLGNDVVTEQHL